MLVKKKILIFTATYNEKDNIEHLIRSINDNNSEVDIFIIDDQSPDQTYAKIKDLQKEYSNIFLKIRNSKSGLDTAHKEAYEFALSNNYDYLITMDADLSHDPKEINNFVSYLSEFPFVIGSRYVEGGSCLMSGKRLVMSKFGNKLIRNILQIDSNEFTTSYRGFNLLKLKEFDLNIVKSKGYSFFMETIYRLNRHGVIINEIPIHFKNRRHGSSKIPGIEIFRTLKNLFFLYFENKFSK